MDPRFPEHELIEMEETIPGRQFGSSDRLRSLMESLPKPPPNPWLQPTEEDIKLTAICKALVARANAVIPEFADRAMAKSIREVLIDFAFEDFTEAIEEAVRAPHDDNSPPCGDHSELEDEKDEEDVAEGVPMAIVADGLVHMIREEMPYIIRDAMSEPVADSWGEYVGREFS